MPVVPLLSFAVVSWLRCRKQRDFFQNNPDFNYEEMFIQHPLLGRYDVPGLLRFMSAHEQRHQSQIASIQSFAAKESHA